MRQLLEVRMALLISGESGRGEFPFIDDSGAFGEWAIRAIINNFPVIQADFSDRRNPRWYTFGHLSLSYGNEMLIWESWLNYPDQVWSYSESENSLANSATQLDLPFGLFNPGTTDVPFILRWQMRGAAQLTVYYAS